MVTFFILSDAAGSHDCGALPFALCEKIKFKKLQDFATPTRGVFRFRCHPQTDSRKNNFWGNFVAASVALLRTISYPVGAVAGQVEY